MQGDDAPLPRSLRAWWGEPAPERSGRRPGLTIGEIVAGAVALADAEGLEGASMPRLAKAIGVGTMSLYRYVASRAELERLMVDAVWGPAARGRAAWRTTLTRFATHERDAFLAHPWCLDIPVTGFPQTPNALSWLELGLAALAPLGLDDEQRLGTMLLLDGHASAHARLARLDPAGELAHRPPLELMGPERFPQLLAMFGTGGRGEEALADDGFAFGLERILAGVDALAQPSASSGGRALGPSG